MTGLDGTTKSSQNLMFPMTMLLDSLKERERHIIKNRILSENPATLEKLGSELNISRERVRQIENSALKKIKTVLEKRGLSK